MAFGKKDKGKEGLFGATAQRIFLEHLARTANVSASARAAGISTTPVYRLRGKSQEFQARYLAALGEGYERLEANLLAEALSPPAANIKDSTLKQKQMKIRLGLSLLSAHRATVRGAVAAASPARSRDPKDVAKRLEARFAAMHKRLNDDDSA